MCVDVGGGGEVAMTQPFLNLLHRNAVCQKKAGAAMTQIVETDRPQSVVLQHLRELFGNIVRSNDVPNLVYTQVAEIVPVVALTAQAAVSILLAFQHQQAVADVRHERQGAQTGLCFRSISLNQNLFAINGCLRDNVLDFQRIL